MARKYSFTSGLHRLMAGVAIALELITTYLHSAWAYVEQTFCFGIDYLWQMATSVTDTPSIVATSRSQVHLAEGLHRLGRPRHMRAGEVDKFVAKNSDNGVMALAVGPS